MKNILKQAFVCSVLAFASLPIVASAGPMPVLSGSFITAAHATSGTATIYKYSNGQELLRLSNFSTSNGPKVHVVLVDHLITGNNVMDRGSIDLGDLKGTNGNQNYTIPVGTDLSKVKAVSIYCERFHVNFGAAVLRKHAK